MGSEARANVDPVAYRHVSFVFLGALLGVALGVCELAWVFDRGDPSLVRRGAWLVAIAAIQGAVVGGMVALGAAVVERVGRRRGWRASAGALRAGVVAGAVAFATLVLLFGVSAAEHSAPVRWVFVLAFVAGAALVAALVTLLCARRFPRPSSTPRGARAMSRRVIVFAALVCTAFGTCYVALAPPPEREVSTGAAGSGKPNIIFLLVDTLRADVLGAYGAADAETPVMDRLAAEGVLFEQAIAPSSWTLPSVASILTSRMPVDHGLGAFSGVLDGELDVLPEALAEAGYACRAVVANELVSPRRGFDRGYELYDTYGYAVEGELVLSRLFDRLAFLCGPQRSFGMAKRALLTFVPAFPFLRTRMTHYLYDEDITDRALRFATEATDRPVFLYVHYLAPHTPYLEHPLDAFPSQPPLVEPNKDELWRRYQGEVTYTDAMIGELLDGLGEFARDAIVVVTADHGEEFWEHGRILHGTSVFQEVVRVPLLIRGPGMKRGARVAHPVSLIDVAPTLLDFAGVAAPEGFRGQSLRHALTGEGDASPLAPVLTELLARHDTVKYEFFAALLGDKKVIRRESTAGGDAPHLEVFDLATDPAEAQPLADGDATLAVALRALEAQAGKRAELRSLAADSSGVAEAEQGALQALGYVDE